MTFLDDHNRAHHGHRCHAHSITPGDHLSPTARACHSLAPCKSILKAAANTTDDGEDRMQAMDMTSTILPEQNMNSMASPQFSPAVEIGSHGGASDGNAYPGAAGFCCHSSIWRSVAFSEGGGEVSMDMDSDDTGYSPDAFFRASNMQEVADGMPDFGFEDEEDYAMGQHKEQSFVEEDSAQSHSLGPEGNTSQPMEFTVPLVHPMAPLSEAWLALQAVMDSGNMPIIPSSDDKENGGNGGAAHACMGSENPDGEDGQPGSFTSTEDSFAEENNRNDNEGNQTINVTQLIRQISLAPSTADLMMEVISVYSEQGEASTSKIPSPTPATDLPEVLQQTHVNAAKPSFLTEPQDIPAAPQKFSFIPWP
ncbi:hypothetical protein EDC04DRAFT_2870149 [Pisolithus marmoratus]|nr:hypothetical protein EDC04DRAFT_2870149 [Pisolithus marmoratus]